MKIGFIGCGNMAKAMMGGILKKGIVKPEDIMASDGYDLSLEKAKEDFGIRTTKDNKELIGFGDVIFLAVKPNVYDTVMKEAASLASGKIFVSIAPGKTIAYLEAGLGKETKILRTMPNTPALVGEGITALCPNDKISEEDYRILEEIIGSFGKAERIDEKLFDAVVAVSGSSPAYVFMFIEAMADAAVLQGMAREKAYRFAAQAVLGSAKMVLESKKHPGELKDMVCSPGGTTIEGVAVLENKGMRAAVIEAMQAVFDKSGKM
ncbi:MAG: pyrroline-5-carboxylate reductase [Johnsonella sp.]|nr:pyrroline-5-carboxylate reductase [Johnsonella sp.]